MTERCICYVCCGERPHTPQAKGGCSGCWCDHPAAKKAHRTRLRVAEIPRPYKDVDELLRSAGGKAFERMIADARPAPAWMVDNLESRGYELTTIEGKQDAADAMLDTFLSLRAIERGGYIRRLAARLEVSEAELRQALNEAYVARYGRKLRQQARRPEEFDPIDEPIELEPEEARPSLADSLGLD